MNDNSRPFGRLGGDFGNLPHNPLLNAKLKHPASNLTPWDPASALPEGAINDLANGDAGKAAARSAEETDHLAATRRQMEQWGQEQLFEEDVRTVLQMLRPNRHERLLGWNEYRTGGAHFRVTVSWDQDAETRGKTEPLAIPQLVDVLESLLVGSARNQDDLPTEVEFELYRDVVRVLHQRINEMESCYE